MIQGFLPLLDKTGSLFLPLSFQQAFILRLLFRTSATRRNPLIK